MHYELKLQSVGILVAGRIGRGSFRGLNLVSVTLNMEKVSVIIVLQLKIQVNSLFLN